MTPPTRSGVVLVAALLWAGAVVLLARSLGPWALGEAGSAWRLGGFTLLVFAILAAPPILLRAPGLTRGCEPGRWGAIGLAIGVCGFAVTMIYAAVAGVLVPVPGGWAGVAPFLLGTLVVVAQSASEEVFFRGWVQPELEAGWGPRAALIATALAFAALHVAGGARAPLSLVNLLLGGLLFGLLAQRSGGLAAPIAAHGGWNWAEQSLFGTDPNPGRAPFGALWDHDLVGAALWGGSAEGINASLGMTLVLAALLLPLAVGTPSLRRASA